MQQTLAVEEARNVPARRRDLIIALRTLRDVGETLQRGDSGGKFTPGPRLMMMPSAWHTGCPPQCVGRGGDDPRACRSTYTRVTRALVILRDRWPTHYWHVSQRYLASERGTRELIRVPTARQTRYFEAVRRERWQGETKTARYEIGEPLERNVEVLTFVPDLRAPVKRREGVSPHAQLVWAGIERWHPHVVSTIVATALDGLLRLLPGDLMLPRDVMDGVLAQRGRAA